MKTILLTLSFFLILINANAQPGSITNIMVSQGTGDNERVVDILFDLNGNDPTYTIGLEVSFDDGDSFTPIDPGEVTGSLTVSPGAGINLTWDGRISYPAFSADMARIKIIATSTSAFQCGEPFTDSRDGQTYNTVLIGTQCWMKENLNYETGNSWCYNNDPANCAIYGRLYDWNTVMDGAPSSNTVPSGVQGICPTGWHVPSDAEWKIQEGTVDSEYVVGDPEWDISGWRGYDAGKNLKATSGWISEGNGTDLYGFTALPGGRRQSNGLYFGQEFYGYWWTSTRSNNFSYPYTRYVRYDNDEVSRYGNYKENAYSLRCLKD